MYELLFTFNSSTMFYFHYVHIRYFYFHYVHTHYFYFHYVYTHYFYSSWFSGIFHHLFFTDSNYSLWSHQQCMTYRFLPHPHLPDSSPDPWFLPQIPDSSAMSQHPLASAVGLQLQHATAGCHLFPVVWPQTVHVFPVSHPVSLPGIRWRLNNPRGESGSSVLSASVKYTYQPTPVWDSPPVELLCAFSRPNW